MPRQASKNPKSELKSLRAAKKSNKAVEKAASAAPARKKTKSSRSLPPNKPRNAEVRSREYLTAGEIRSLKAAASKAPQNGFRDRWLIAMMYAHALRVSEACDLRWKNVDLKRSKLQVQRLKNGDPSVHFLEEKEVEALKQLRQDHPDSEFVFNSQRGGPISSRQVHTIIARAGELAGIADPVHPHMLRHSKGFQLAAKGADTLAIQGYFGHKAIQHTARYTKLNSKERFKGFGRD